MYRVAVIGATGYAGQELVRLLARHPGVTLTLATGSQATSTPRRLPALARVWNGVFGVEEQYDIVHATFADGSFVPKIPPQRLGGGVYYRAANWTTRVNLLHAFAQNNLGAFETPPFDTATVALARIAAALTTDGSLVSVAGGGDTVAALNHAGVSDDFTFVSTAGGAFLEWMEGRTLPGVAALGA